MHLDTFELHTPKTLDEVLHLAREHAGHFDYLAGGTDLLPNYKMHLNLRPHLIALEHVAELTTFDPAGGHLGAMVRLRRLENDPVAVERLPGVVEAASQVATPLVRASGTLGGNLLVETRCFFFNQSYFWRESLGFCLKADGDRCHVVPQKTKCYATFSGDLAPTLMVLDAQVELLGPEGRRRLSLADLYAARGDGIRRTTLNPGELLVGVHLTPPSQAWRTTYRKLRIRPSFDFPELGVAVALAEVDGRVQGLRIALGGLETYPRLMDAQTQPLIGERLTDERLHELAESIKRAVRPVHNTFLAPDYRKQMTEVYVRRAVQALRAAT